MQYLDKSDSRLKLALQVTNTGIWEWDLVTGQLSWSETIEQLFGIGSGMLAGNYKTFFKRILPSDRRLVKATIARAIKKQTEYRTEFRIRHPDGSIRWLTSQGEVYRDSNRKPIKVVGLCMDITPNKQVEAALARSEVKWRSLIQNSSDLIAILAADGTILYESPASERILGYSSDELVGKPVFNYIAPQEQNAIAQAIQNLLKAGHKATFPPIVFHLLCKDGTWCCVEASGTNLLADEAVEGIVINARDVTKRFQALRDLKHTQDQLVEIDKMANLGQLVAGVAHEINDPVSFISGNIIYACDYVQDLLKVIKLYRQYYPHPEAEILAEIEEIDLDFMIEDLPKLLKSMKVGAERIHQIVLSLRSISRPDEFKMKPVDIHQGIDDTLMILQNRLKAKRGSPEIKVTKNYDQLPLVECHTGQLNQVFMNLINNAIDALEEARLSSLQGPDDTSCSLPFIHISTEAKEDNRVIIKIADNGTGMTAQVKDKIFDCFFSTKPDTGNGLGLWISHKIIVEKHQGRLHCLSAPGQGTEFIIEIPIKHSHDSC
ncbi:MAG TPA: hypothetical protein DDZ80_06090 [Cyanobacteria bacterium UBA8803]|nr:hypothetical protein [Cyanobacteria bacterium UBA9273]HBL58105.1 hypothetical protein [Cyanobacteria bacterium UBA8803]